MVCRNFSEVLLTHSTRTPSCNGWDKIRLKKQGSLRVHLNINCCDKFILCVISTLKEAWKLIGECLSLTAKHHLEKVLNNRVYTLYAQPRCVITVI